MEEQRMRNRLNKNKSMWMRINNRIPRWLLFHNKGGYGLLFAAATVLIGFYAYYLRSTNSKFSFSK